MSASVTVAGVLSCCLHLTLVSSNSHFLPQVGCLLRNLTRGRGGMPELTGLTPLHMLIEIGCEKIKKDYINIFQGKHRWVPLKKWAVDENLEIQGLGICIVACLMSMLNPS